MSTRYTNSSDVSQSFCPDAWVAIAYAEYLENLATETLSYQSDIAEFILDERIDAAFSSTEEDCEAAAATLSAEVVRLANEAEINLSTIDREGDEFQALVAEAYDNVKQHESMLQWSSHLSVDEQVELETDPYKELCALSSTEIVCSKEEMIDYVTSLATQAFPDGNVAYKSGYYSLRHMAVNNAIQAIAGYVPKAIEKIGGFSTPMGVNIPIQGDLASSFSVSEMADEVCSSAASAFASAGMFRASAFDTASDRIAQFTNYVSAKGSEFMDQAKGVVSSVRETIADVSFEVKSAFQWYLTMTGLDTIIAGGQNPDQNDFTQYTGASPILSMSFGIVGTLGKVIGVTIGIGLYGIYEAGKALLGKAGSWIKKQVRTFSNPVDMQSASNVIGNTNCGYVDKWLYRVDEHREHIFTLPAFAQDPMGVAHVRPLERSIVSFFDQSRQLGGGICIHLLGGEMILALKQTPNVTIFKASEAPYNWLVAVDLDYQIQFKPACISFDGLKSWMDENAALFPNGRPYSVGLYGWELFYPCVYTIADIKALAESFKAYFSVAENAYVTLSDDMNEADLLMGYATGLYVSAVSLMLTCWEMGQEQAGCCESLLKHYWGVLPGGEMLVTSSWIPKKACFTSSNITNSDMLKVTCGWNGDATTPGFLDHIDWTSFSSCLSADAIQEYHNTYAENPTVLTREFTVTAMSQFAIAMFVDQRCERYFYPTDYMFLPYSQAAVYFSPPDWIIPTDAQNVSIAMAALVAIMTLVIIVVGYFLVGKLLRVLKAKGFKKWNAVKGPLDNKMWNGKALSAKEQKMYLKASCKLDAIGDIFVATGGGVKGFFGRLLWPARTAVGLTRTAIGKITGTVKALRGSDTSCEDPAEYGEGLSSDVDASSASIIHVITGQ